MRTRNKAFLSCALVAGGLFAATDAMAADPPLSCNTGQYGDATWTISVTAGPTIVSGSTELEYEVAGAIKPDHVATLASVGLQTITGTNVSGNQIYGPCIGDPLTGLGKYSCHQQAAKVNPNGTVTRFKIRVAGELQLTPTSVVVKKGSKVGACEIAGLGVVAEPKFDVFESIQKFETVVFKGCAVKFEYDLTTGEIVGDPVLDLGASTKPNCNLIIRDVTDLKLELDGIDLKNGRFGNGYISSGLASCTTRVIGGRVYTWGDPCPEP